MGHLNQDRAPSAFGREALRLDVEAETKRIRDRLRRAVHKDLRRQGAVVGISGGIDSSVVLALCVRAIGAERTLGVLLPEKESSADSVVLADRLAAHFDVQTVLEDIAAPLEGFGCYQRRDRAIAQVFPDYAPGWKAKIVLPGNLLENKALNFFSLVVVRPDGQEFSKRLPLPEYRQIVAATNFKQRTRMATLYYHAEVRHYAVVGTANKNEHDLGFFVKYGDGGIDVNPIAHLFKSQLYQLAAYLDIPEEIQKQSPTTDTYSAGGTQEEFFFRLPFEVLDLVWLGYEQGIAHSEIARTLELSTEQVERVIADIVRKQRTTAYLRTPPLSCAG